MDTNMRDISDMEKRIIRISGKRQITIPQKFYEALNFGDEAECMIKGDTIIIKPFHGDSGSEFAEFILADLISEGYSGETLLNEFKARNNALRGAVKTMISEADLAAAGANKSESLADVFGTEE